MNARLMFKRALASLMSTAILLTLLVAPAAVSAADTGWQGEYFSNRWLSGSPTLIRTDANVAFRWGTGSPDPRIPADGFSVRWTRLVYFEGGRYLFTVEADDGVRLFVDGQLIVDQWRDQPPITYSVERDMSRGDHAIRIEYYENTGGAVAHFRLTRLDAPTGIWRGEYYNNPWLSGSPVLVRQDNSINFDWGTGSPAAGIPSDRFSVRWSRTAYFEGGRYRFTTETDDGVRLYLDGQLIIDQWRDQSRTTYTVERDLSAGNHSLRMEYYENTGAAVARLSWTRSDVPVTPTATWRGEYYANQWLSGSPVLVRQDNSINFDWGNGSPDSRIPSDRFSVRWTRAVSFQGGRYRFTTVTDDGVRLYIDGNLVIDRWMDMAPTANSAEVNLTAGVHSIRMEYYENGGGAVAKLFWEITRVVQEGNLVTCVRPTNSWIKAYRWDGSMWVDVNPRGWGAVSASGFLKIDGLPVDVARYGGAGQPYRVELWANNVLIRSVGNTSRGEPEFRIRPGVDNHTPWGCPAP